VNSISDVVSLFQERATIRLRRFSLENYIQIHLAWGLCLIALDEVEEGERHLELFCTRFSIDRNDRIICKAELEAKNAAHG